MAVEDGAVLGELLGLLDEKLKDQSERTSDELVRSVLSLYEKLRKLRTTTNVRGAVANRSLYHMPDGPEQVKRDKSFVGFKFETGRSEYIWADSQYQKEMLGFDAIAQAAHSFHDWWVQKYKL